MNRNRVTILTLAAAILCLPGHLDAQRIDVQFDTWNHPALRIGQDYALKAGDGVREVVVIAGDATIEGRVDRDVVVVFGKAQLASTAVVEGSFVVIGGTAIVSEGAQVREDLVVLGGFEGPAGFNPGGHHVVVGTAALGGQLRASVPWLTRGLLWGRPIVPWLPWVWTIAAVFFLVNLCLNLVFDPPAGACAATLRATPMSSFMTGLLMLLLMGPICLLLAVSVVGLAVVPFVICALLFAAIIGKIGFARWIGMSVARQDDVESRLQSLRSFLIGSAIMCVAYMVPILGFVTWTLAGVFGLGAGTLAFFSAYRRENPKPLRTKASAVVPPLAPVPVSFSEPAAADAIPPPEPVLPPAVSDLLMHPRAAFGIRLAAFALDVALLLIVVQLLGMDRGGDGPFQRLGLLLSLAYHVGFWTWKGTTLGGIICQLRVVRIDGAPLRFAEALIRGLTGIFSLAVLGLGFLWILKDPERQAWHDRVAGTYVVTVPRNWPI